MIADAENIEDLLAILFGRGSQGCLDMVGIGQASARNEPRICWSVLTALGEPLKVVGVVDVAGLDGLAGDPGERLVAARAEHLVAVSNNSTVYQCNSPTLSAFLYVYCKSVILPMTIPFNPNYGKGMIRILVVSLKIRELMNSMKVNIELKFFYIFCYRILKSKCMFATDSIRHAI